MPVSMVITARFPLGIFLGHRPDGARAEFPDTARLHAALTHAAGQGSTAETDGLELRPRADAIAALKWLEEHPPAELRLPGHTPVASAVGGRSPRAWRDEGVIEGQQKPWSRRVAKPQSDAVALAGPIGWGWEEEVPDEVRSILDQLCADVSCLGEADSPAVLEIADRSNWEPTHRLDLGDTAFPAPGGVAVRTPVSGRFDELEELHRAANPLKRPSVAQDRHAWGARPSSHAPGEVAVRECVYRAPDLVPDAPWAHAITIPVEGEAKAVDAVAWSVALHRAIVAHIRGGGAPAVITGRYDGQAPPANRVAIHLVQPHPLRADESRVPTFVVMLPPEIDEAERELLEHALAGTRRVYRREGDLELGTLETLSAKSFWKPPRDGDVRHWRPTPALVPEVRRQGGTGWSLQDAVALSVGHVFRDWFKPLVDGKAPRYRGLAQVVRDHGVRGCDLRVVRDSNVSRYVHKTPRDLVVQPVVGLIDVGHLVTPTALFAAGQSRHLGGGLMIPEDVPAAYDESRWSIR